MIERVSNAFFKSMKIAAGDFFLSRAFVYFRPVSTGDVWWWCGADNLCDKMPINVTGVCALVTLLLPVSVFPTSTEDLVHRLSSLFAGDWHLSKRSATWLENDPTYIDAIGVPRGVPDDYELADQVAAGFENIPTISALFPVPPNQNVDRVIFIHFNGQKLGHWTLAGFEAVHGQLQATSLMPFQNRIALDMLLAEKGGVCSMFGEQCCIFIPNITAADGSLTRAIEGLRALDGRMGGHSGVDATMWDTWLNVFGNYRALVSSLLVFIAVFAAILTLCGCCCIPCLRSSVNRLIITAISPAAPPPEQLNLTDLFQ
ncbi:syncytin-B [Oryzias melastigma]|uniref:syncytin-B n=1 Tax=Oryzias melastigma TaxID=30732 RepID=UPI00168CC97F|nr:syncytin-B [Oryzias melastigma]